MVGCPACARVSLDGISAFHQAESLDQGACRRLVGSQSQAWNRSPGRKLESHAPGHRKKQRRSKDLDQTSPSGKRAGSRLLLHLNALRKQRSDPFVLLRRRQGLRSPARPQSQTHRINRYFPSRARKTKPPAPSRLTTPRPGNGRCIDAMGRPSAAASSRMRRRVAAAFSGSTS